MKVIKAKRKVYEVLEDSETLRLVGKCPKGYRWWCRTDGFSPATASSLLADERNELVEIADLDQYLDELTRQKQNYLARQRERLAQAQERQAEQLKTWIDEAMVDGVLPATYDNVHLLLRYLNAQNWGCWCLPQMAISYTCNQYDCDGKTATTITLDEAIRTPSGEMYKAFVYGAPRGHLNSYERI